MTAGDIPATTGNPDQGFEGFRFVGYNLYDGLALWDLSQRDKPSDIKPGLATEWQVDPNNHRRWIFKLRQGVKWHDGCPFTADDVLWNFAPRHQQERAAVLHAADGAVARPTSTNFESVEKIDDHTVAITTKVVESLFPYSMSLPADGQPLPRGGAANTIGPPMPTIRPAPARTGSTAWSRMSGWSWCPTRTTGTQSAYRNTTGWC